MRLWRITDDQYIARVSRFHRNRRHWGFVLLVVGVVATACVMWFGNKLMRQAVELVSPIADVNSPSNEDITASADSTKFVVGFVLGACLAGAASFAASTMGLGLGLLLFRDRKTEMLLDCLNQKRYSGQTDEPPIQDDA